MRNIVLFITAILLFTACGTAIEQEEVDNLVFGYDRGLMVGVEIGDSWEDVKKNHREGWTIVEEGNIYQFRKDWDQGNDMMNVTFTIDENKNVDGIELSMTASEGNWPVMKMLEKKMISDLNLITSSNSNEKWSYFGPNGNQYTVLYEQREGDENRKYFSFYTVKNLQ